MTERREILLAAACRVIARHGVRGLRVEDVAAEGKSSTALIYYHFKDRAGLIVDTMEYVNRRAGEYPRREAPGGRSGYERLLDQMMCEFQDDTEVRENSAVWGEVRGAAVFDPALRPIVKSATLHWTEDLATIICEGQQDGSIDVGVDPVRAATRLTALVEGLSNRWLAGLVDTAQVHGHITEVVGHETRTPWSADLAAL